MAEENNRKGKITAKKIALGLFIAALLVVASVFLPPVIKNKVFEHKVKQSLISAYPDAKIKRVIYKKPYTMDEFRHEFIYSWKEEVTWPEESLYLCEIYPDLGPDRNKYVHCLSDKDGNVVFDEYAFFHFREELKNYVTGILDAEKNFPGIKFEYYDVRNENGRRMVKTASCKTFEDYLSNKETGHSAMSDNTFGYASCWIGIDFDAEGDDREYELCRKLSDIFIGADCKVCIKFVVILDGRVRGGRNIASYYPESRTSEMNGKKFVTERFEPYNKKIQERWKD